MPKTVTDDEVAKHDNTLEPDPDPIVNGDDAGVAIALPMKRKIVDKDDKRTTTPRRPRRSRSRS